MISIKEFIRSAVRAKYPTLDISDNSPLSELFLNPAAAFLQPVIQQIEYLLYNLGLNDPAAMDAVELDAIAANFLVYRNQGSASYGYVTLSYDTAQTITIPAGTLFYADDGRSFITTATIQVSEAEMSRNLDKFPLYSTSPIPVVATVADGLPIAPGQIVSTTLSPTPTAVTNDNAFIVGSTAETNEVFAARLLDSIVNRSLASQTSIQALLAEKFPTIQSIAMVGAGDDKMLRDLYYSGVESLQSYKVVDYRGKVSIGEFYSPSTSGTYIRTSGVYENVPNMDEYPYPRSKAYWSTFYDDPATSGIISDLPSVDLFQSQFTTPQYANLYYRDDALRTTIGNAIVLDEPFVPGVLDVKWITGDAQIATDMLRTSYEITLTTDGIRLGNSSGSAVGDLNAVTVTRSFLASVKEAIAEGVLADPRVYGFLNHIDR